MAEFRDDRRMSMDPQQALAWRAAHDLARRLKASNTARQFGFELRDIKPDGVVFGMRVGKRHLQVHKVVHGGVLAALADTAGGFAVYSRLPMGSRVATVEMKINFLEPVVRGEVMAYARVIRLGKNFGVVDCDLTDHASRLVGKALMTFAVVSRGKEQKRGRRP